MKFLKNSLTAVIFIVTTGSVLPAHSPIVTQPIDFLKLGLLSNTCANQLQILRAQFNRIKSEAKSLETLFELCDQTDDNVATVVSSLQNLQTEGLAPYLQLAEYYARPAARRYGEDAVGVFLSCFYKANATDVAIYGMWADATAEEVKALKKIASDVYLFNQEQDWVQTSLEKKSARLRAIAATRDSRPTGPSVYDIMASRP